MSEQLNELWKRYDDAVCYLQQAMQDGFNVHGHLMAVAGLRDCIEHEIGGNPKINATFECTDGKITGTMSAPVKRIELQDDGSFTVVIDYCPKDI